VKAIDDGAYVVMGPVFSGSILVSMAETKRAEIPNFTGGEAAAITQQGNPYIFRTSFTQTTAMPKVARYLADNLKAKTLAIIYTNNDFGKGGRDVMMKAIEPSASRSSPTSRPIPASSTSPAPCSRRSRPTPMRCSSTPTRKRRRARCAS
jgi:ABC-type branched-subunit amino acid transport system substrate-binding protein